MKILLYGMQSSGASTLAYTLAQKPDSVAFVDIWNNFAAPLLETDIDTVAKVVVTTAYTLREHVARFKPDVTIAVLRHPVDNYDSLVAKTYINESGLINEKFREMEATLAAGACFDHIVFYEDLVFSPGTILDFFGQLGWHIGCEALRFPRAEDSIRARNNQAFPWLAGRLRYGIGNFRDNVLRREMVRFAPASGASAHLPKMCPKLFAQYESGRAQRGGLWHVPKTPLLACDIGALLREVAGIGTLGAGAARDGYLVEFVGAPGACAVGDGDICLSVVAGAAAGCLRVSGLPGAPFDRISARVWPKNPCGAAVRIDVAISDAQGAVLGHASVLLSRGDMAYVDVPFRAQAGTVILAVSASPLQEAGAQTVCIEALQLAQLGAAG